MADSTPRKQRTELELVDRATGDGQPDRKASPNGEPAEVVLDPEVRSVSVKAVLVDPDVYRTFEDLDERDRPDFALRAFKAGVLAIRDAWVVAEADYVQKEFERMRDDFHAKMDDMFGEDGVVSRRIREVFGDDGEVDRKLRDFFGDQGRFHRVMNDFLGEEGKLERAVGAAVGEDGCLQRTLDEFFGERGRLRVELDRAFGPDGGRLYALLNPSDETTPLGKFRASLEERLDPNRKGSLLWNLTKEIRERFQNIEMHLGMEAAVEAERERGTHKGRTFEEAVTDSLLQLARPYGDRVENVGDEGGVLGKGKKVGDIVCHLANDEAGSFEGRVVLEVKDRGVTLSGKTSIYRELDSAIKNRDAHFAIAVVERQHAEKFGPLHYAAPNQILVALDSEGEDLLPLEAAYRFARMVVKTRAARRDVTLDVDAIKARIKQIRTVLEQVRPMKTGLTGAVKSIKKVHDQLDGLRASVLETVDELENDLLAQAQSTSD